MGKKPTQPSIHSTDPLSDVRASSMDLQCQECTSLPGLLIFLLSLFCLTPYGSQGTLSLPQGTSPAWTSGTACMFHPEHFSVLANCLLNCRSGGGFQEVTAGLSSAWWLATACQAQDLACAKAQRGPLFLQRLKQFNEAKWWWDEDEQGEMRVIRMKIRLG